MTLTKAAQAERDARTENAREILRRHLKPGMSVHATVVHRSKSGMSTDVRLFIASTNSDGAPYVWDITGLAVRAMGDKPSPRDDYSVRIGGWGTSPTFLAVYSLSRSLWPEGHPCTGHARTGKRGALHCPSNDHMNGDRAYRRGKVHSDGGYALTRS